MNPTISSELATQPNRWRVLAETWLPLDAAVEPWLKAWLAAVVQDLQLSPERLAQVQNTAAPIIDHVQARRERFALALPVKVRVYCAAAAPLLGVQAAADWTQAAGHPTDLRGAAPCAWGFFLIEKLVDKAETPYYGVELYLYPEDEVSAE